MASAGLSLGRGSTLRAARWENLMVVLAAVHAVILFQMPTAPVIALGLWWNANTISHNFIHRPFFRSRAANWLFAAYLSLLLGFPQALWRDRHLAHHAGVSPRLRVSAQLILQVVLVLAVWIALAVWVPRFFLEAYLPGYLAGLGLCALHGYYEHARGATSYYGAVYNLLLFNDGFHVEHHADPSTHWTRLPEQVDSGARVSVWPAPLRWIEGFSLEGLERLVLRSPVLQGWVLRVHARALRRLTLPAIDTVAIVGGGIFPRTALIFDDLLPGARITIIDSCRANLEQARALLGGRDVEFVHARYAPTDEVACDLLVIPLSFRGDRDAIYARPPARAVLVHDWIWRKRGESRVVSMWLLKRVNLVGGV